MKGLNPTGGHFMEETCMIALAPESTGPAEVTSSEAIRRKPEGFLWWCDQHQINSDFFQLQFAEYFVYFWILNWMPWNKSKVIIVLSSGIIVKAHNFEVRYPSFKIYVEWLPDSPFHVFALAFWLLTSVNRTDKIKSTYLGFFGQIKWSFMENLFGVFYINTRKLPSYIVIIYIPAGCSARICQNAKFPRNAQTCFWQKNFRIIFEFFFFRLWLHW